MKSNSRIPFQTMYQQFMATPTKTYRISDLPKLKFPFHLRDPFGTNNVHTRFWEQFEDLKQYVDFYAVDENDLDVSVAKLQELKDAKSCPMAGVIQRIIGVPNDAIWETESITDDNKENESIISDDSGIFGKSLRNQMRNTKEEVSPLKAQQHFEIDLPENVDDDDDFITYYKRTYPRIIKPSETTTTSEEVVKKQSTFTTKPITKPSKSKESDMKVVKKPLEVSTNKHKPLLKKRKRDTAEASIDLKKVAIQNLQAFKAMNRRFSSLTSQIEIATNQITSIAGDLQEMRLEADTIEHNLRLFVMSASVNKQVDGFIDDVDDDEDIVKHYDKCDKKRQRADEEASAMWNSLSQSSVIRTQTTESSYVDTQECESGDEVLDDYDSESS